MTKNGRVKCLGCGAEWSTGGRWKDTRDALCSTCRVRLADVGQIANERDRLRTALEQALGDMAVVGVYIEAPTRNDRRFRKHATAQDVSQALRICFPPAPGAILRGDQTVYAPADGSVHNLCETISRFGQGCYELGRADGQNILLQLATGEATPDQYSAKLSP